MPVEPADELPELLGGACHDAGGCWCCGQRLLRVGNHCRDSPFLSNHWYDAGLRDAVARDSCPASPTFQEQCHGPTVSEKARH